jgi:exosortase
MTAQPLAANRSLNVVASETARNRLPLLFGRGVILAAMVWAYAAPLSELARRWSQEEDYSHCFLVPVFAAFLLWHRRSMIQGKVLTGSWLGLPFLLMAGVMRWIAAYDFYPMLDFYSLLPCLAGAVLMYGGRPALKWTWPAIAYLFFMIPLPGAVAFRLSHPLQRIATISSTWLLQLFGVPAVSHGNVIWLTTAKIVVIDACSGLRMLMLFFAITVGASFLIRRPLWEKIFVGLSAFAIGVITNILRITVTALLHEHVGSEMADLVFHDLAGWLMMPIATLFLCGELFLLSKLLITPANFGPLHVKP